MMRNLKYTAAFAAAVLFATLPVACTDDPAEPAEPTAQSGDLPVRWNVKGVVSPTDASRVMIVNEPEGGTTDRPSNPSHPGYYVTLQEACSVPKSGSREDRFAIGLFGDYTYTENGNTVTFKDFYRGDRLVFLPTVEVKGDVLSQWDTNTAMKYWHPGAMYIFSAYYPQRLYNYTVSTSTATTLALTYPSRKLQYDLLHGVTRVKATDVETDKDGKEVPGQMYRPVDIQMEHVLAALRFKFKLNFEDADLLTSVYLLNLNEKQEQFFTQGTAIFGKQLAEGDSDDVILEKLQHLEWKQDYNPPSTEILYKWVPPLKYWYGVDANNDGIIELAKDEDGDGEIEDSEKGEELSADAMLEYWGWNKNNLEQSRTQIPPEMPTDIRDTGGTGHIGGTGSGETHKTYGYNPVLMYSSSKAISTQDGMGVNSIEYHGKDAHAYCGTELYYDITDEDEKNWKWINRCAAPDPPAPPSVEIDEYRPGEAMEVAAEGKLFCRNAGWLLIPPQQSYGGLTLCFTTKKGGATLYQVKLPVQTGTRLKGDVVNKFSVADVAAGKEVLPEGTDVWAAGYRYTYSVTISQSNFKVNVSIEDWNERKHSTEIIF